MQCVYLLLNPTNRYAVEMIKLAYAQYHLRPVVVWLRRKDRLFWRQHLSILRSKVIAAEYCLDHVAPEDLAQILKKRFHVQGVVPYAEQSLSPAACLLEHLDITWNTPDLIRRFRDKNMLKDYLRTQHPHLPMNTSRLVRGVEDVFSEALPQRFVIKPNAGMANRDVAFFDASSPRQELEAYFKGQEGQAFILEDFLEGPEFAVNGQMDAEGHALILNVTQYERVAGNGKPNLYRCCFHIRQTHPAFEPLASYAQSVMEATGLVRCPFHMEVMLTPQGPRMIEVGARFAGLDYVYIIHEVHGQRLNAFDLALHHWLFDTAFKRPLYNWAFYNTISFLQLDGICHAPERIYALDGVEALEALPEFHAWVFKPRVGQQMHKTVDLYTIPYSFQLKATAPHEQLLKTALWAETLLQINTPKPCFKRFWIDARETIRRLNLRAQWMLGGMWDRCFNL